MCDGREEVSIECSSPHTPIPEGNAERESALRKKEGGGKQVEMRTDKASLRSL